MQRIIRAAVLGLMVLSACAAPAPDAPDRSSASQSRGSLAPPSPEAARAIELGRPGAEHQMLAPLAGNWNTVLRAWNVPGADPEISEGKATASWIFGDRFLSETFTGQAMGTRFEGKSLLGYDRAAKKFVSTWADSLSTSIGFSEGIYDSQKNMFVFRGKTTDAATGRERTTRAELRILTPDKHTFQFFEPGPDGREFRSLEIVYTRN